jgi:hypothetical protein
MEKTQWSPLAFENKHTIMLALTSNEGFDFQTVTVEGGRNYITSFRNFKILEK